MLAYDAVLPKALLPVAGKPFAHWQLTWLGSQGVDVVYSIGNRGALIRDYVKDGSEWGLSVTYVEETDELLGTGGAVRLALDEGLLQDRFFVLYGDSYVRLDLSQLDREFERRDLPAIMTIFANDGRWDSSNVIFDGALISRYEKNLPNPPVEMRYIDQGLSEFTTDIIREFIPPKVRFDLSVCLARLSHEGRLGGFEVSDRFYEVGSPDGIKELDHLLLRGGKEEFRPARQ